MIVQEFPDTIPGVVQKITTLAHTLGKGHRIFNASDNFAEVGLEFENLRKESNMLLMQALRVEDGVQLTCSPWVKSWRGSRIVVPNLAQDEAMAYIRTVFIPALEEMYPRIDPQPVLHKMEASARIKTQARLKSFVTSLVDNLWAVGLWAFFLFLVFYLPNTRTNLPSTIVSQPNHEISACFCQQVLAKDSVIAVTEAQRNACEGKYICEGNAKASCLLQTERAWSSCEF